MKKTMISLFVSAIILIATSTIAYTQGESDITAQEQVVLSQLMDTRDIGGDVLADILYDQNENPSFIIGTSSSGYLIMVRDSYACMEWGTGGSPYNGFEDDKKYYGGILCYYVTSEDNYYSIVENKTTNELPMA